jgi:hypothetical protein
MICSLNGSRLAYGVGWREGEEQQEGGEEFKAVGGESSDGRCGQALSLI